jgi:heme A synthase
VVSATAVFRPLAIVTATFAYLQIALGGVVRVSGSGLGCPDWPLCHGRPYPPANLQSIIEYSHRAVGSVTGVLIIATVVLAWVVYRSRRPVVAWLATASLVAVAAEGALGGIVVANELTPWLVVVHLGLAMIILGVLVATAVMAMPPSSGVPDAAFRRVAAVAAGATYLLLLSGSTVVASSADRSCNSWPLCGNGFVLDFGGVNAFTMLHRGAVLVIGVLLVYTLVSAFGKPGLRRAVFAIQVAVGAAAAIRPIPLFDGLHVALATLVFAGMLTTALLTLPRTDRGRELTRLAVEKGPA